MEQLVPVDYKSWRASVLCRGCEDGWINAPYLCGSSSVRMRQDEEAECHYW